MSLNCEGYLFNTMTDREIQEFDRILCELETRSGADSLEVARHLEGYARLLREKKMRTLDAVNMEAKARVIRSKHPQASSLSESDIVQETKRCPFCAETILKEARICRFCNRNLSSETTKNWKTIAGVTFGIFGAVLFTIVACNRLVIDNPPKTDHADSLPIVHSLSRVSSIGGSAWLSRENGSSEIIRGLQISLCDSKIDLEELGALVDHYALFYIDDWPSTLGIRKKLLTGVSNIIAPHVIRTVRTGVDGKYKFENVHSGNYYLAAQDSLGSGYLLWVAALTVSSAESTGVDLDNSNAFKIVNTQFGHSASAKEYLLNKYGAELQSGE